MRSSAGSLELTAVARDAGDDAIAVLELALVAALVSPQSPVPRRARRAEPERASAPAVWLRAGVAGLSYFLWSSMPDEELLAAAEQGRLGTAALVRAGRARCSPTPAPRR